MLRMLGLALLLVCSTTNLLGCKSRGLVEVTGVVKVDGNPTPGVTLMFFPSDPTGVTASGTSDESGKFTLTSGLDTGLVPGNYVVTASWPDPSVKPTTAELMQGTYELGPDLLKGKYSNKQTTPIKIDITGSLELPPIELKKG